MTWLRKRIRVLLECKPQRRSSRGGRRQTSVELTASFLPKTIPTQMFNGYGDQVAGMYTGMDLRKYF